MDFMIFDSAGNAVDAFDSERGAIVALLAMAREDSDASRQLAILAFDDAGEAIGEPLTVADVLPEAATTLLLAGADWISYNPLTFRQSSRRLATGSTWLSQNEGARPLPAH